MKFLIAGIVIIGIYFLFFKKRDKKSEQIEDSMMECPKCSTFVTKNDAIIKNGEYYCSQECAS